MQIDLETPNAGGRRKLILSLAWPALAENVLASLVSMVDMIMVSALGSYAISAVGLVTQPRFIMLAAFMALNIGCTALVARFRGANDQQGANDILRQSLLISSALSVVLCAVMLIFINPLIHFIAGPEIMQQTIDAAISYFVIQLYGFPLTAITFAINATLRGVGNTRAAFYTNTVANLVNVVLNYCLIEGKFGFPRMEVAGASLATVIGQAAAFGMALYMVLNGKQYIRLDLKTRFHFDFPMIKRILNIGTPAMIEQLIMRVGMLLYTMIVTRLGDVSYTAHMVAMNIQQLSFTSGMAFGTAATTLVGQSLGRKNPELAKDYMRKTQHMGFAVACLVGLILFVFGRNITHLYSRDFIIIELCAQVLKIVALSQPFQSSRLVFTSGLRGAGDARFTAVITFVGVLLIRPLLSVVFISLFHMGLIGAWIALVSDQLVCYVLAKVRFERGKWALIKV